jgi:hypothetical protein
MESMAVALVRPDILYAWKGPSLLITSMRGLLIAVVAILANGWLLAFAFAVWRGGASVGP